MKQINSVISLFFGNISESKVLKRFWRFILMLLMFSVLIYFMPGHITFSISYGISIVLYYGSLIYFDKTYITKSLSISHKKQVVYTYAVTFILTIVFSLILFFFIIILKIQTNEKIFNSTSEALSFLIMYCALFMFFVPLCFIIKNGIWNAYFFIASLVFLVVNIVIENMVDESLKLIISIIVLILSIFISYRFSCLFNRPKRYCVK